MFCGQGTLSLRPCNSLVVSHDLKRFSHFTQERFILCFPQGENRRMMSRMIFITLIVIWCLSGNAAWCGQDYHRLTPHVLPVVKPVPAAIGPFEISNADSSSRIRLQFAGQLRMLFESKDQGSGKERTERSLMEARRLRLILDRVLDETSPLLQASPKYRPPFSRTNGLLL